MQVNLTGTRAGARVSSSITAKEIRVDLTRGVVRIDDATLRRVEGNWVASVRLQKRTGRNVIWTKLSINSLDVTDQERFIEYIAVKDGCPPDEAVKISWDSMVASFFDGNETLARQQMAEWIGAQE
jgi:hypothetical protein